MGPRLAGLRCRLHGYPFSSTRAGADDGVKGRPVKLGWMRAPDDLSSSGGWPAHSVTLGGGARGRRLAIATATAFTWGGLLGGMAPPVNAQAPQARTVELAVDGEMVSGPGLLRHGPSAPTLRLHQGEAVRLRWTSDRPLVLHLHGYRLAAEASPGRVTEMAFTAKSAGRFAVETHRPDGRHATLLYLEVMPR